MIIRHSAPGFVGLSCVWVWFWLQHWDREETKNKFHGNWQRYCNVTVFGLVLNALQKIDHVECGIWAWCRRSRRDILGPRMHFELRGWVGFFYLGFVGVPLLCHLLANCWRISVSQETGAGLIILELVMIPQDHSSLRIARVILRVHLT